MIGYQCGRILKEIIVVCFWAAFPYALLILLDAIINEQSCLSLCNYLTWMYSVALNYYVQDTHGILPIKISPKLVLYRLIVHSVLKNSSMTGLCSLCYGPVI